MERRPVKWDYGDFRKRISDELATVKFSGLPRNIWLRRSCVVQRYWIIEIEFGALKAIINKLEIAGMVKAFEHGVTRPGKADIGDKTLFEKKPSFLSYLDHWIPFIFQALCLQLSPLDRCRERVKDKRDSVRSWIGEP